jgi:hypothetical protein
MSIRGGGLTLLTCCFFSIAAYGDDFSKFEIYGAYSVMRTASPKDSVALTPNPTFKLSVTGNNGHQNPEGLTAGIGYNLNQHFGFVGEFGWNRSQASFLNTAIATLQGNTYCYCIVNQTYSSQQNEQTRKNLTLLAGPRFSVNFGKRFRPFAQVLIGWHKNSTTVNQSYYIKDLSGFYDGTTNIAVNPQNDNSFSMAGGGGLDMRPNKRFSLRLFEIDVVNSREAPRQYASNATINYNNGQTTRGSDTAAGRQSANWAHNLRLSIGALFHLGNIGK